MRNIAAKAANIVMLIAITPAVKPRSEKNSIGSIGDAAVRSCLTNQMTSAAPPMSVTRTQGLSQP